MLGRARLTLSVVLVKQCVSPDTVKAKHTARLTRLGLVVSPLVATGGHDLVESASAADDVRLDLRQGHGSNCL